MRTRKYFKPGIFSFWGFFFFLVLRRVLTYVCYNCLIVYHFTIFDEVLYSCKIFFLFAVLTGKVLIENEVLTDLERECVYMFMKKKQEENDASTPMTSVDVSNIVNEQLNQRFGRFGSKYLH